MCNYSTEDSSGNLPMDAGITVEAVNRRLIEHARRRADQIAALVSANDCHNRFLSSYSIIGSGVWINLSSFFEEERRSNPNWFGELSRALKAEITAIFQAAGWNALIEQRARLFSTAKPTVLTLARPIAWPRPDKGCCGCGFQSPCQPEPGSGGRVVPEGVLTVTAVVEKLETRARELAAQIVALASENDYNNSHLSNYTADGRILCFDMTDILAPESKRYPLWSGNFYELQAALKLALGAHGWKVKVEHRTRTWKPDRYILLLEKRTEPAAIPPVCLAYYEDRPYPGDPAD